MAKKKQLEKFFESYSKKTIKEKSLKVKKQSLAEELILNCRASLKENPHDFRYKYIEALESLQKIPYTKEDLTQFCLNAHRLEKEENFQTYFSTCLSAMIQNISTYKEEFLLDLTSLQKRPIYLGIFLKDVKLKIHGHFGTWLAYLSQNCEFRVYGTINSLPFTIDPSTKIFLNDTKLFP